GPAGGDFSRRADQGDRRLGPVQVFQGRVAAGQPGCVRAQRRLRSARRAGQRLEPRPTGATRQRELAGHLGLRHGPRARGRGAGGGWGAGEVDWWEIPPLDFIPKIEQNASLATFLPDPLGTQGWLRPNHLHPPFNNKKARQALVYMMSQETYLQAAIGVAKYY